MSVEEGLENELSYIEFRQTTKDFTLRIPKEDVAVLDGLPGPSMLACSNRHGLLFMPLAYGFGWTKLSRMTDGSTLEYGKFDLEETVTSALVIGGPIEKWLIVANGPSVYLFEIDSFAADPSCYEPKKIQVQGYVSQIIVGSRVLALAGQRVVEIDCENACCFETELETKLIACDKGSGKLVTVSLADELLLVNSGFQTEKRFRKPADLEDYEIVSLCCINEWDVILGVEPKDKTKPFMDLYHVDISASDSPWVQFFDPTRPRKKAPACILSAKISSWGSDLTDLLFVANPCSPDIGTMGRLHKSDPISTFFLTTEEFLPQLPVSCRDSRADQYPIGIALDFTNPELTPAKADTPPYPASPVIWILTNEGFLCAYRIIKSNSKTPYHEMNLNTMDFPSILKKRASRKVQAVSKAVESTSEQKLEPAEQPLETGPVVQEKEEAIDFNALSSGFVHQDYGKFTNALINEFLQIRSLIENDLVQLRITIGQNSEMIGSLYERRNRNLRHLERDTIKLAQECDNPAFLDLYWVERDVHELAHLTRVELTKAKSLKSYSEYFFKYSRKLKGYWEFWKQTLLGYQQKIELLQDIKSSASVEEPRRALERLRGEVLELEKNMSLLKLSNTRNISYADTSLAKPSPAQLSKFASKLTRRSPSECLSIVEIEDAADISARTASVPSRPSDVDSRLYSCVFPAFNEEEFASEPESSESEEDVAHPEVGSFSDFEYDEIESPGDHEAEECEREHSDIKEHSRPSNIEEHSEHSDVEKYFDHLVIEKHSETKSSTLDEKFSENAENSDMTAEELKELRQYIKDGRDENVVTSFADDVVEEPFSSSFEVIQANDSLSSDISLDDSAPATGSGNEEHSELYAPLALDADDKSLELSEALKEQVPKLLGSRVEKVAQASEVSEPSPKPYEVAEMTPLETPFQNPTEAVDAGEEKHAEVSNDRSIVSEYALAQTTPSEGKNNGEIACAIADSSSLLATIQEEARETSPEDGFSFEDMNMVTESEPVSSLGSMDLGEPSEKPAPQEQRNVFGVPSSVTQTIAPVSSNLENFDMGAFKPPTLGAFTPKAEESIFNKPSATAFGQPSAFGKPSAFGQPSAFGLATAFGQTPAFGQNAFGQTAFGQSAFGSSTFGQPSAPTTFAPSSSSASAPAFGTSGFGQSAFTSPQPAKIFGQGPTAPSTATGFSAFANSPVQGFGNFATQPENPTQTQQQQQTAPVKKNLPPSFSQFRD